MTFVLSESIGAFGYWAEQLLAESTGKEGKGLVPVESEALGAPEVYGPDRVFVWMRTADSTDATVEANLRLWKSRSSGRAPCAPRRA